MPAMTVNPARLAARALTVAAGLAVFVSLFLAWTRLTLRQLALLAVTANGSLGRPSLAHDAWESYAGVASALTALSALIVLAAVSNRVRLIRAAALACLAALVFVIVQVGEPPSALPSQGPGAASAGLPGHVSAGSVAGAGETLAIIALVAGVVGMRAMIAAARAERRRARIGSARPARPRRQRATGSAARSWGPARSAGDPPAGSA
jgi:hypothetical protein